MLLEREIQLAHLRKLFDTTARKAGRGQVAVITGPVGSGKTELLHTFAEDAVGSGAALLTATGSRAEQAMPLGVLDQIFRGAELPAQDAAAVSRLLKESASGAHDSAAGGGQDQPSAYVLHSLSGALLDMVRHSSRPLLIGIDDVDAADEASLRCLAAFTRRIRSARVLVVLTESVQPRSSRIRLQAELPREPQSYFMRLDLLSAAGAETMLSRYVDRRTAQRLAPEYHALSGGNPLLLRGLIDDLCGADEARSPRAATASAFAEALLSCLYRCESSMLQTARGLAVLGGAATPSLLAALAGIDADSAQRAIGALKATGVLDADGFRHPDAAPAVLHGMAPAERTRLHAAAAHLLYKEGAPATSIARQLLDAEDADVPGAVDLLHEAAEQALSDNDTEAALSCLRVAHRRAGTPRQRAVTTSLLIRTEGRTDPALALRRLPELTEAVRAGHLPGRDLLLSVGGLLWFGRPKTTLEALRQVGGTCGTLDLEARGHLRAARGWLSCVLPPSGEGLSVLAALPGAGPPAAPGVGSSRWVAGRTVSTLLAEAGPEGRHPVDAEHVLQQCRLDEHTFAPLQAALATLVCEGRLALAESWSAVLADQAGKVPVWEAMFSALRAENAWRRGDLHAAERHARTALRVLRPQGWGLGVAMPLSTLLHATTALGRLDEAAEVLREPLPDSVFRTPVGLVYLQARGHHQHAIGQYHAAVADFRTVGELVERWDVGLPTLPTLRTWRTDAAQSLLCLDKAEQARELAEKHLAECGEDDVRLRAIGLRVLAATADPERRPVLLSQAADGLQSYDDRLELAHTLHDLGLAHRALGHHSQARMTLRNAHHLAMECGAPTAARTLPEPEAAGEGTGADTPPAAEELWTDKLSDAEYRVAMLAASDHSNQQIARKLFITVSTVEQHLTRVYRKLNVTKRTDLVRHPQHPRARLAATSDV